MMLAACLGVVVSATASDQPASWSDASSLIQTKDFAAIRDGLGRRNVVAAAASSDSVVVHCSDGVTAYDALEATLAKSRRRRNSKPYEVPDSCENYESHTGARIQCSNETPGLPPSDEVFKFRLLLGDCEPVAQKGDRARNEIKIWGNSPDELKGFFNTTMRYTWWFMIDSSMRVSRRFTHLFQLKAVGGDSQHPLATFTGVKDRSGNTIFEIRNCSYSKKNPDYARNGLDGDTKIRQLAWSSVTGHWVKATVEATTLEIGEGGRLKVDLVYANGTSLLSMDEAVGLWRGANEEYFANDYVRPKWGIYRKTVASNIEDGDLNDATVYFANFTIEAVSHG